MNGWPFILSGTILYLSLDYGLALMGYCTTQLGSSFGTHSCDLLGSNYGSLESRQEGILRSKESTKFYCIGHVP